MAELVWTLCDLLGRPAAAPESIEGSWVQVDLNGRRFGSHVMSFEDEAAPLVSALDTTMKVRWGADLILAGPIVRPSWSGSSRRITSSVSDLSIRLMQAVYPFTDHFGSPNLPDTYHNYPEVAIHDFFESARSWWENYPAYASGIFEYADGDGNGDPPPFGIDTSADFDPAALITIPITRNGGDSMWALVTQVASRADGTDFEVVPLDGLDGLLGRLVYHYPYQGRDLRDQVVFEYGWGQENCSDFTYEQGGDLTVNQSGYYGDPYNEATNVAVVVNDESLHRYGRFGTSQAADIPDATALDEYRQLALRDVTAYGSPPETFTIVPAQDDGSGWTHSQLGWKKTDTPFGVPPRFAPTGDFWIGDIVRAIARDQPGLDRDLVGRVVSGKLTQVQGAVVAEVTCKALTDAGIRSAQKTPSSAQRLAGAVVTLRSLRR